MLLNNVVNEFMDTYRNCMAFIFLNNLPPTHVRTYFSEKGR
jgi:hypothetical protein